MVRRARFGATAGSGAAVAGAGAGVAEGLPADGEEVPVVAGGPQRQLQHERAVAVEDNDVPGAEVVAVPTLPDLAGGGPEVVEVAGGVGRAVLVVAGRRPDPVLVAAPGRVVAGGEVRRRAVLVDVVAGREHDGR